MFTPAFDRGLMFAHRNGDFTAISVTERSRTAPISKVESHISDSFSYYRSDSFSCEHEKLSGIV